VSEAADSLARPVDHVATITALVEKMLGDISWTPEKAPDFDGFARPIHPAATLVPAARPIAPTDIATFLPRMRDQHSGGAMRFFEESPLGTIVHVFGNIAVALGGYQMVVDRGEPRFGVNAFLLVHDGEWRITGMAWDMAGENKSLPDELATPS